MHKQIQMFQTCFWLTIACMSGNALRMLGLHMAVDGLGTCCPILPFQSCSSLAMVKGKAKGKAQDKAQGKAQAKAQGKAQGKAHGKAHAKGKAQGKGKPKEEAIAAVTGKGWDGVQADGMNKDGNMAVLGRLKTMEKNDNTEPLRLYKSLDGEEKLQIALQLKMDRTAAFLSCQEYNKAETIATD